MLRVVKIGHAPVSDAVPREGHGLAVHPFSGQVDEIIHRLRREANATIDTFTKYVFQTLSISGVALGAIIEFMFFMPLGNSGNVTSLTQIHSLQPLVGLAAFPILIFALAVCRIGTYYYTDSNRQFGFELFLSRVRLTPEQPGSRWRDSYINIDWEEALRAWRVVQETLFHRIHPRENLLLRHVYADDFKPDAKKNPRWFCQASLFGANSKAVWKAGKFLDTMQLLLLFLATIASFILWLVPMMTVFPGDPHALIFYFLNAPPQDRLAESSWVLIIFVLLIFSLMSLFDNWRERPRRRLLSAALALVFFCALFFTVNHYDEAVWKQTQQAFSTISNAATWRSTKSIGGAGRMLYHALVAPFASFLNRGGDGSNHYLAGTMLAAASLVIAAISSLAVWLSARNERARREMLKDGILSLHSCSIVWEAVVIAHFNAVERSQRCGIPSWELAKMTWPSLRERYFGIVPASMWSDWQRGDRPFEDIVALLQPQRRNEGREEGAGLPGYTFWLGQEAASLARCADAVPSWISLGEDEMNRRRHAGKKAAQTAT
jgi:hypothetical protein